MEISTFINSIYDNVKGFWELSNAQTHRYHFVIENLDIVYLGASIKTKVHYTPLGSYRPLNNLVSDLDDELVCRKFKPEHAKMIVGISTLEHTLDFTDAIQTETYLRFVKSCMTHLRTRHE